MNFSEQLLPRVETVTGVCDSVEWEAGGRIIPKGRRGFGLENDDDLQTIHFELGNGRRMVPGLIQLFGGTVQNNNCRQRTELVEAQIGSLAWKLPVEYSSEFLPSGQPSDIAPSYHGSPTGQSASSHHLFT